jgi:hypothetical protein
MLSTLEAIFPALNKFGYEVSSPRDVRYNCIAFAAGDYQNWWEPKERTVAGWCRLFKPLGFRELSRLPSEFSEMECIAIYAKDNKATHVAIKRGTGPWTSKLGKSYDIVHNGVEAIEGVSYGSVARYMVRAISK